jgi:beta-glucosidase
MSNMNRRGRLPRVLAWLVKLLLGLVLALLVIGLGLKLWLRVPPAPPVAAAQPLPADFIWGVSSSAFQSEGGDVDSNMLRNNKKAVGAQKHPEDPYGSSVDFRHRYREDVALAKGLGINTYRIGINWARVEPKQGQIDQAELAYYDDLIKALKEAGIQPLITLDHFVHPGWVADQGGWSNPQTVDEFVSFVGLIANRYHADVHWWLTFNETAFFMIGDVVQRSLGWSGAAAERRNLIAAHRRSYELIHQLDPQAMVSSNIVWTGDTTIGRIAQHLTDCAFLDAIKDRIDYVALDYYTSDILSVSSGHQNWLQDPPGLYRGLRLLSQEFPGKPLLIAENGMATENGKPRPDGVRREDALRDSVYWVQRARADGIDVVGYLVWSLTDNFEWGSYTPRFGLYTVNVLSDPSLARIPTAAVPAYREIIADHGVPPDYRPVLRPPN